MRLTTYLAAGCCALAVLPGTAARGLTLEDALARAARNRPELRAVPHEVAAGEGRLAQAGVRPGPGIDLEARNAFEETAAGLSVVQERGGKREARVAAARADLALLAAQADVRRLEIGHQVRTAYTAVLAAEAALALSAQAADLASSLSATVAEKVRAGAASPIEETRAAVRFHGATAGVERARREVARARAELARAVADPAAGAEPLEGSLAEAPPAPDGAMPAAASPDVRVLECEVRARRAALDEERARSAADLTWRVAANHSRLDEEAWLTVGVEIPLAFRARNRGALGAAAAELDRAELERAAEEARVAAGLREARAAEEAFAREAAILGNDVLASAGRALATVEEGYRLGKFPYLDVLDASQVLLEARLQHTAALAAAAQARHDVDRLLGGTTLPPTASTR